MFLVIKTLVTFCRTNNKQKNENCNFTAVDENNIRKMVEKVDNKKVVELMEYQTFL